MDSAFAVKAMEDLGVISVSLDTSTIPIVSHATALEPEVLPRFVT